MPSSERNRHALIDDMERLYLARAWSDQEMADQVETDRTNVWKIRTQVMEAKMGIPLITENGRHRIDRTAYVANIRLTPPEALALYIGGRRLQQHTKTGQKDVANALQKLANALHKPLIGKMAQAAKKVLDQEQDEKQAVNLRKIMEGWMNGRYLELTHRVPHAKTPRKYTVIPYQLEPSVWGDGIYLIGYSDYHQGVATFKLSRIEHVFVTTKPFDTPDFDSHAMLHHAWGIWHSDKEPVIVRLQFTAYVTPYVKETIWHPEQTIQDLPEGGCIWQTEIAEPKEMLPWIRGWGNDVEVLEPTNLRKRLKQTAVRLNRLYKTMATTKLPYHIPYAKTNPDNREEIHLLLYHLIDVGKVARTLWQDILTDSIRQRLAYMLNLTEKEAGRFIAFLASLHDLGKAGPAYQHKYAPEWLKKELNEAGLILRDDDYSFKTVNPKTPHATVSTWALINWLPEMIGVKEKRFARDIAVALGGHHGAWPPPGATGNINDSKHEQWDKVRRDLVWELKAVFNPPTAVSPPRDKTDRNTFLTIFSGLVSVADWLGSRNEECFGFIGEPISTRQYAARSQQKAQESLADLGWMGWKPTGEQQTFAQTFAYLGFDERPVQKQVIEATRDCPQPTLLILEAPTGIGKTETAVYIADSWLQKHHGRGLYVAMPTQATSNQMYDRIGKFLHHRYPDMRINYHLVHGQAPWLDDLKKKVELQSVGDDPLAHVHAESWFTSRKRTLLAPFGVGTVDQTLMSILQTRHFFVRLFGLSHKVVIFDEVHAYDTFMNTLFHRLLAWLNAIGTSVIILSATLPAKTRRELVNAYSGHSLPETEADYPALTIANAQQQETISLDKPKPYPVELDWSVSREPEAIVTFLKDALTDGGCTAVICNTVRRAQDIYRALQAADLDIPQDDLILFHARFPPIWRQGIEKKVLEKFGKPDDNGPHAFAGASCSPHRPRRAIVVATQVIEQSLDLDFDLMISDLAPVDLILQRAGRLHRHKRTAQERHNHPHRLIITQPLPDEKGLPEFESDKYVYEPYVLLRSYLTLQKRQQIIIPSDTINLIEAVYGSEDNLPELEDQWTKALDEMKRKMENNRQKAESKAGGQLILAPSNMRLMKQAILQLEEDDPEVHQTFRAQTRDIDPGVSLICLHQNGAETADVSVHDGQKYIPFNLEAIPFNLTKTLLKNMLTIHHRGVINALTDQPLPQNWKDHAALSYARPLLFINGICNLPDSKYYLKLTQTFGLEIIKKETV